MIDQENETLSRFVDDNPNPDSNKNLIYIENFSWFNDKFYWHKEFKKSPHFDGVVHSEQRKGSSFFSSIPRFTNILKNRFGLTPENISHIHFGGSISSSIPIRSHLKTFSLLREHFPHIRITAFCGDLLTNPHNIKRANIIHATHTTTMSHTTPSTNIYHAPPPIDPEIIEELALYEYPDDKLPPINPNRPEYITTPNRPLDAVFIGNKTTPSRINHLYNVARLLKDYNLNLNIFGQGWREGDVLSDNVTFNYPIRRVELHHVYNKHLMAFDDADLVACQHSVARPGCLKRKPAPPYNPTLCNTPSCRLFKPTHGWLPSRPLYPLISKTPFITPRRPGQEDYYPSPFYFDDMNDIPAINDHIKYIINPGNSASLERHTSMAQHTVLEYSYEQAINRLVEVNHDDN